jgi:glycosyltransferase involved in cell wall biosynthesis
LIDVSIIVPIYNPRERLSLAIESALEQSAGGVSVEVIAVNDCSPDDSASVLAEMQSRDPRLKVITLEENQGAGPARNAGLDAATARYVTFLDPDDVYPKGALQKLVEAADKSGLDLTRGNILEFDAKGIGHPRDSNTTLTGPCPFDDAPVLWAPWMHQQFLFRRDFLQRHGIRYPALRRGQDSVMLARALARCDTIQFVDTVVYHYTIGVKSMQWGARQFDNILDHFYMVREAYLANGRRVQWMNYLNAFWNFWRHLQNGAAQNFSDIELKEFLEKSAVLFVEVDPSFFELGTHKLFQLDACRVLIYQLLRRKKFELLQILLMSNVRLDELLKPFNMSSCRDLLDQISIVNQDVKALASASLQT